MESKRSTNKLRNIERKYLSAKEQYEALLQSIPDIIYEVDPFGKFLYLSDAIKRIGYNPKELIGKHFKSLVHPDDCQTISRAFVLPMFEGKVTGDKGSPKLFDERRTGLRMTQNLEIRVLPKSRDRLKNFRYVEVSSSGKWDRYVKDRNKSFLGSIGIIRDITEKKQVDKLKDDFISTVSHEIRTPISITKEGIELVLDNVLGEVNKDQQRVLSIARENIIRLTRIVNELLDISKIEAGNVKLNLSSVDLVELVRNVCSSFELQARSKDLSLKLELPSKKIRVMLDADKIIQVFTNLIANAIKFTNKGYIKISVVRKNHHVECCVADTGVGIAKQHLSKVFNKFQQFHRTAGGGDGGTGLGLSIAKNIVELHKGKIWVESVENKGTKFTFALPI